MVVLWQYRDMLYERGVDCRLDSVFRDEMSDADGASSSLAAVLEAMAGVANDDAVRDGMRPLQKRHHKWPW